PRFFQPHNVSNVRFILFVVSVELLACRNDSPVQRMRLLAGDLDNNSLVHAVRDDFSDHFFAASLNFLPLGGCIVGHDYFFSLRAAPNSCSRMMVFTRAISLRRPRIFFRLSVCPMLSWNFSLKSWSARSRSWWRSSVSVRLRTFSDFIMQFRFSLLIKFLVCRLAFHECRA